MVILIDVDVVISVWLVGDSTKVCLGVIVIFYLNTEIYKKYLKSE